MATAGCFSEHEFVDMMGYGGDDYGNKKYYFKASYGKRNVTG